MTDQTNPSQADQAATAAAEARKRAPAANFLPIVRGRMPMIFVHAIRFNPVLTAMANSDLANKFATSVGKVFDIKKNKNFTYITADFKPTQDDVSAAEAWIAQVGAENAKGQAAQGDKSLMQSTLDEYKTAGLATAEQAAAFSAARTASRPAKAAPAAGADAGQSAEKPQAAAQGADLLS